MGILDHVLEFCDVPRPSHRKLKKRKQLQVVEIKIKMDCIGCEPRIRKSVEGMKGVNHVKIKMDTAKAAEPWPYVPYGVIDHPYAPGAYDKKAPPGYVRNMLHDPHVSVLARAGSSEVKYTRAFSDDDPNACVVM